MTNPQEQVNEITLRSGTVLEEVEQKEKDENPLSKVKEESDEEIEEEVMVKEKPTSPKEEGQKREKMPKQRKEKLSFPEIPLELAHHTPRMPFPQRCIAADAELCQVPQGNSGNKRKLEEREIMMLTEECSAILKKKLPQKLKVPIDPSNIQGDIIEDVLVKVDKFIFLVDFFVLDMEEDKEIPLILG
ncbi:uncharacterized protein LOC116128461 [Pistacia vera]|uniref:uncharacterized protein LOC116128461 n=1 Tax=Pistacia vera TaxID=55513 RepID=UPI0012634C7E|nr:uncharacterized protein LOC116128461 [Pistacia vera]